MNPSVVLDYLATCSGNSINVSSCLVSTWINGAFPDGKWGDRCSPFSIPEIDIGVMSAYYACGGGSKTELARSLAYHNCWEHLCEEVVDVEVNWMKTCANVSLPLVKLEQMDNDTPDQRDLLLSCMLHEVMSSSPTEFGLPEELGIETCYPPGFAMMDDVCPGLALNAYNRCADGSANENADQIQDDENGVHRSVDYEYNSIDIKDVILAEFCTILGILSSDENLECLVPLCDYSMSPPEPHDSPPSSSPTEVNAIPPIAAPTLLPSYVPSFAPTHSDVQLVVEATIYTEIEIRNLMQREVPTKNKKKFMDALKDAISYSLPFFPEGDSISIAITEISETSRGHGSRHLKQEDPILYMEIKAIMFRECFLSNCADPQFADGMTKDFTEALLSIMPYPLSSWIYELAATREVPQLMDVYVESHGRLHYVDISSRVLEPEEASILRREAAASSGNRFFVAVTALCVTVVVACFAFCSTLF